MSRIINITKQCIPNSGLAYMQTASIQVTSVFGDVLFVDALSSVGYGNSPDNLAELILSIAAGPGSRPSPEEIDAVASVIVRVHQRTRSDGDMSGLQCVTRIAD